MFSKKKPTQFQCFFFALFFLWGGRGAFAESPTPSEITGESLPTQKLQITLKKKDIKVGELVSLQVSAGPGKRVQVQDQAELETESTPESSGQATPRSPLVLFYEGDTLYWVPVRPGENRIPSLVLLDEEGHPVSKTESLSVQVGSMLGPEEGRSDQKNELEFLGPLPLTLPLWVKLFFVFLSLGVLGILIYWVRKWIRSKNKVVHALVLSPFEELAQRIQKIEEKVYAPSTLFDQGVKKWCFEVTEIFKTFLNKNDKIDAPESTTEELIALLEEKRIEKGLSNEWIKKTEKVLGLLDQVKFTQWIPPQSEFTQWVQWVKELAQSRRREG